VITLRALLYADARSAINQLKEIRRSPGRAIMWAIFALTILGGIGLRIVRAAQHQRFTLSAFPAGSMTDVIVCFIIVACGATLAGGSRLAGLFAHPAEARFIIGSPATPFVATLYVQAREIAANGARRGVAMLYAVLIYLPDGLSAGAFVRDLIIVVFSFATIAAVPLARQLLAKPFVPFALTLGWASIVAGILPLVRDAAVAFDAPPPLGPIVERLPPWHPGELLLAGAGVQNAAIALLVIAVGALFIFVARAARDAYPELYELSMNRLQRVERLRGRVFASPTAKRSAAHRATSLGAGAPPGVMIFVWRAWTEYRRMSSVRATALETGLLLVAGYGAARLTAGHPARLISFSAVLATLLWMIALARSATLATELRRPIFWLSRATLYERLCALALAHGWRLIGWFVLAAVGLAAGRATPLTIAAALLCGPAAVLFAISVGYASYGLFPHDVDQRGPLLFVRWLLGYVLVLPAMGAGLAIGIFADAPLAAVAGASATALLEAAVLIGFAAWRLDRTSISLR
jgi:hypothetical protein